MANFFDSMSDKKFGRWIRKQVMRDLFWTDFLRELIQRNELTVTMKSYNDFHDHFKKREENVKQFESLNEAFGEYIKYAESKNPISRAEFQEIYRNVNSAQQAVKEIFAHINLTLTVKCVDDVKIFECLDNISREINSLRILLGDVSTDHIENFDECDRLALQSRFESKPLPRGYVDEELLEIARDEFRIENFLIRNNGVPKGYTEK
ncbi:hypothetical protein [Leptospira meyeri]|uniref:hypothetical protein n=1 Tax=Leptospira meyeri TaxID=29508 RepID=UPI00108232B7|nr:hypothetical protein [Leptospira meyeri]TGL12442.1 hypothetical protein EHQ50_11630 [Leptospira meyeri]